MTRGMRRGHLLLIPFMVALLVCVAHAYRHGDPVNMMKRSQRSLQRTNWSPMLARDTPRFGMDRTVTLSPFSDASSFDPTSDYKISFSFADERFLTPWITISDGAGTFLNMIEFDFTYAGDYLTKVTWKLDYHPPSAGASRPEVIFLRYHWHEFSTNDTMLGYSFFLVLATLGTAVAALLVVLRCDVDSLTAKSAWAAAAARPAFTAGAYPSSSSATASVGGGFAPVPAASSSGVGVGGGGSAGSGSGAGFGGATSFFGASDYQAKLL